MQEPICQLAENSTKLKRQLFSAKHLLSITEIGWTCSNYEFPIVDIVENGTTKNVEFNISGFTGINDMVSNRQVVVSPTLANDFIDVNSSEMIQHVSLINLQGQVVFQYSVGNQQTRLNVSNIASGTYFVKTKTANHTSISKVVIGQ